MHAPVELKHAFRLINHGPVTIVSAAHGGRENLMAVAWCMAVDFNPPKLAIVLAEHAFTRALIDASGELVVQVPPRRMLDTLDAIGNCSGRDVDKWTKFSIARSRATKVGAPLVDGCVAWLECKVIREPHIATAYDLFVIECVAAHADPAVFANGRWRDDIPEDLRSVHHVAGGNYVVDGARVSAER